MKDLTPDMIEKAFLENQGLVASLTQRAYRRVLAAHLPMSKEDVFQEASVAFVMAMKAFDPDKGVKFSTYYARAFFNNINARVSRDADYHIKLGVVSLSDGGDDMETNDVAYQIASDDLTPDLHAMEVEHIEAHYESMSDHAKRVVDWVLSPPPFLLREIESRNQKAMIGRKAGNRTRRVHLNTSFALGALAKVSGLTKRQAGAVRRELEPLEAYL